MICAFTIVLCTVHMCKLGNICLFLQADSSSTCFFSTLYMKTTIYNIIFLEIYMIVLFAVFWQEFIIALLGDDFPPAFSPDDMSI